MRAKLQILAWALALLALAHPSLIPPVLGTLGVALTAVVAIAGWVLANASLALTVAAALLVLRAFPGISRWLRRAWVASVAAVAPVKA